jgi:hypothetical protein
MKKLKIIVYDVGLGDCILIHYPNNELALIDSKTTNISENCPALDYIKNNGNRLKFICLTHPHADHYTGMLSILRNKKITVDRFYHSMSTILDVVLRFYNNRSVPKYKRALSSRVLIESRVAELLEIFDYLYEKGIDMDKQIVEYRQLESAGDVDIYALAPNDYFLRLYERRLRRAYKNPNNNNLEEARQFANKISAVLFMSYGKSRIIFGADAEIENWQNIVSGAEKINKYKYYFPVNVFKASHHGATNGFYDGMWNDILSDDCSVVVSSGGKHPTKTFIYSIVNKNKLYCTNHGECRSVVLKEKARNREKIQRTMQLNIEDDYFLNDELDKCFGKIEINVFKSRPAQIIVERNENRDCMVHGNYTRKK